MPAPYITAHELIQQAHALDIHPYDHTLNIADEHGWAPAHTLDAIHAVRQTAENLPQPYPTTPDPITLADTFSRELDLPATVASYLSTLDAYQQSGDPSEAEALEALEAHLTRLVN